MSRLETVKDQKIRRAQRVRAVIRDTSVRPRLSVTISNRHISAQIIDDEKSTTLVYVTTVGKKLVDQNMMTMASDLGVDLAKKAKLKKISKVVFDRGGKIYHGRVKALADSAREGGLEF
jgi:large subunit ribosomal protein L18